jgi:hypothetical protein
MQVKFGMFVTFPIEADVALYVDQPWPQQNQQTLSSKILDATSAQPGLFIENSAFTSQPPGEYVHLTDDFSCD